MMFGSLTPTVHAANTCTFTGATNNDWGTTTNWSGCGTVFPTSADAVVIPTAKTVTMSGSATVASLTFNDAVNAASSLTVGSGNTLTVSGATTYTATTGTAGATLDVGAGNFSTGTLVINDGAAAGDMVLRVSTGNITVTGDVSGTWTNTADVQITSSGISNMYFGGNFPSGATFNGMNGTVTFNGSGAQNIGAYATYNNVVINKSAGTATLLGTTNVGNLTLTAGTLDTNSRDFSVGGASSITGTILFSTGAKTFTGDVTLNSGAVWTESGASTYGFTGNFTNNATTFTASTGAHTFSGTAKIISGSTTTTIPSVSVSGTITNSGTMSVATLLTVGHTLTNTGTVTATTSLTGAGIFENSTSGTLNIGDANTVTTFTTTATGNTVKYTKAGAQTIAAGTYYNLTLNGSGVKTTAGTITVAAGGILTIDGPTLTLNNSSSVADKLYFGTSYQRRGTWGATASSAYSKSDTYFTTGINQLINVTNGYSHRVGSCPSDLILVDGFCVAPTTTDTTTPTITVTVVEKVTCPAGQKYETATGKACTDFTSAPETPAAPVVTTDVVKFTKSLNNKSSLADIKNLQTALNKLGATLVVDGKWGTKTTLAVKAFQKKNVLSQVGTVGPLTRAALNKALDLK